MALTIGQKEQRAPAGDALARARQRAALVPDLLVEAQRIANTVASGWHGRRRRGAGDTFWQFRPYDQSEGVSRIDWRRSARDDAITVRDQEWEAAHTAWIWADNSASMLYRSGQAEVSKQSRALVIALSLAEVLARSGERVGWPGVTQAVSARNAAERIAAELVVSPADDTAFPPVQMIRPRSELIVVSDFLEPMADLRERMEAVAKAQVRGTLVHIIDPAENTFPFDGRTQFIDPELDTKLTFGRAEGLRDEFRTRFIERQEAIREYCRRLDWNYVLHQTDTSASTALVKVHTLLSGVLA